MIDIFGGAADVVSAPATRGRSVAPSDTAPLGELPKALFVGGGGSLVLEGADGVVVTFRNVPDGTVLPFRARRVLATGTTAMHILALL